MSESLQERIRFARKEAEIMKEKIKAHREELNDTTRKLQIHNNSYQQTYLFTKLIFRNTDDIQ